MRKNNFYGAILAALTASFAAMLPAPSFAQSDSLTFSPDSAPYGQTYDQWTAEWWKWFISIPTEDNPINDATGERCALAQKGPVWFFVGSGGGTAERNCTIPEGRAILIPAINVECSYAEDESLATEDDLRACATGDQDLVTQTGATLDGSALEVHRVQSPVFDITFPADNIFAAPEGSTQAVSEGFWVFVKPLPPGEHELHAEGLLVDPTITGPVNLIEDSTYHLTVESLEFETVAQTVSIADKSFEFPVRSTSAVSNIAFDEQAKQLSFSVSGNSEGTARAPIGWLLAGPVTVMMDSVEITDYEITENQETGETSITIIHAEGDHEIVISGTNVVPEFPYSIFILLATIGIIVILGRTGLMSKFGFCPNNR
jgi:hypothetical protein